MTAPAPLEDLWLRAKNHQVVFNENDEAVEFTPHTHAALFGHVLEGECELVIEGESKVYRAGDVYHVPKNAQAFCPSGGKLQSYCHLE